MTTPTHEGFAKKFSALSPLSTEEVEWIKEELLDAWEDSSGFSNPRIRLRATYLRVAHCLVVERKTKKQQEAGGRGRQSGRAVGAWRVTFAREQEVAGTDAFWNLTTYGKRYLSLRFAHIIGMGVAF